MKNSNRYKFPNYLNIMIAVFANGLLSRSLFSSQTLITQWLTDLVTGTSCSVVYVTKYPTIEPAIPAPTRILN